MRTIREPSCIQVAGRRQHAVSIVMIGILLVLVVSCHSRPVVPGIPTLVSGFKSLDLPRNTLPIGAKWIQGIGPDWTTSLKEEDLQVTRSVEHAELKELGDFSTRIATAITQYAKLDVGIDQNTNYQVNIDDVEIVCPKSPLLSGIETESLYLWEGLRVRGFSVSNVSDVNSTAASLEATFKKGGFSLSPIKKTSSKIQVATGNNLYVGYRVVQIGRLDRKCLDTKVLKPEVRTYALGGYCTIQIRVLNRSEVPSTDEVLSAPDPNIYFEDLEYLNRSDLGKIHNDSELRVSSKTPYPLKTIVSYNQIITKSGENRRAQIGFIVGEDYYDITLGTNYIGSELVVYRLVVEDFAPTISVPIVSSTRTKTIDGKLVEKLHSEYDSSWELLDLRGKISLIRDKYPIRSYDTPQAPGYTSVNGYP